jgi:(1->4)-alpha-D-glucan 1-alpha-D-glucosylmutase
LVVEKILAPGEHLPAAWPVDGTTGYEHARALEHAMLDTAGWEQLAQTWVGATGDERPFRAVEVEARGEVLDGGLRPDLARVAVEGRTDIEGLRQLSVQLRRYRTYLPHDPDGTAALEAACGEAVAALPDAAPALARLTEDIEAPTTPAAAVLRTRWQQLTGPATAKGVEDRAFWRWYPLATLAEVGGHPVAEPGAVVDLHAHHAATQTKWPHTLLAGTTHDTKRSEDVRAFGLALATAASAWGRVVDEWLADATFPELDVPIQWLALQTVATAPELSAERLEAFLVKAAREADLHTSWTDPDETYERRVAALARDVIAWPAVVELAASLDTSGRAHALGLLAVRCTAPGVPDLYQGSEAYRFLLVDPDNRDPPDDGALDALVDAAGALDGPAAWSQPGAPAARAVVLRRLLALRRAHPDVFEGRGGYRPLDVDGGLAFARLDRDGAARVVVAVARTDATDTSATIGLPPGEWRSVLDDGVPSVRGRVELRTALTRFPAVVLVS